MEFLGLDPGGWDRDAEEHANRGVERQIERNWFRLLRQTPAALGMKRFLPAFIRKRIVESVARTKVVVPPIDTTVPIVDEFTAYTRADWQSSEPFRSEGARLWS